MSKGFKNYYFLILAMTILPRLVISQSPDPKETWVWPMHNGVGLKFTPDVEIVRDGFVFNIDEASTALCDTTGELLFYCTGGTVFDKNHQIMTNGNGLMGTGSSAMGAYAVRKPGSYDIYYIFTTDDVDNPAPNSGTFPNGFRYSVVDMSLEGNGDAQNPLGEVTEKNVSMGIKGAERIAAAHAGCGNVWIITKEPKSNRYASFLLTENGIDNIGAPIYSEAGAAFDNMDNSRGEMLFSPDEKKFAVAILDNGKVPGGPVPEESIIAQVFNFDWKTGKIIDDNETMQFKVRPREANRRLEQAYGIAFSPNGSKLYVSNIFTRDLFQFDLDAPNDPPTFFQGTAGSNYEGGLAQMKLGPDGKIYVKDNRQNSVNFLTVIENPDVKGNGCNVQRRSLNLGVPLMKGMPDMYVAPPNIMMDSVEKIDIGCSPEGEITIYVHGGSPEYEYSIDDGATWQKSNIFKGLKKGKYLIRVRDSKGCEVTEEVEIEDKPAELEDIIVEDDSCKYCSGSIIVLANGGSPPFEYSIDGGITWKKDSLFEDLCAGDYDIKVKDQGGCIMEGDATIKDIGKQLDATISPAGPLCMFDDPIQLESVDEGGVWSGPGVDPETGIFDPGESGPGVHKIKYSLPGNCGDEDEIEIIVYGKEEAVIEPAGPFCHLGEKYQLTATPPGGVWSGPGVTPDGLFDPSIGPGIHTITYKFEKGECGDTTTTEIDVKPLPEITITGDPLNGCSPLEVNFSHSSDPEAVSCKWDFGNGTTSDDCNNAKATYVDIGCYDVSLSVETAFGCRGSEQIENMVCVHPDPIAEFTSTPKVAKLANPRFSFFNQSTGAVKYFWTFDEFGSSELEHPQFLFPEEEATFIVCLRAESEYGCLDSICHEVEIIDEFSIYVPNAFSPNGDGINDYFYPIMRGYSRDDFKMEIFNRWGEAVYKTKNTEDRWDGAYRRKDELQKQEVYIWKIKAKDKYTGKVHRLIGHFSLLK